MSLPAVGELHQLYAAADEGAIAALLAKLAVEKSYVAKLDETRQVRLDCYPELETSSLMRHFCGKISPTSGRAMPRQHLTRMMQRMHAVCIGPRGIASDSRKMGHYCTGADAPDDGGAEGVPADARRALPCAQQDHLPADAAPAASVDPR